MSGPDPREAAQALDERIAKLMARGVEVLDPRQTYVGADVDPQRIAAGVRLFPGTRLMGARTWLGPGSQVGSHGPATLIDCALGPDASVHGGYAEGVVLLDGASLGADAHARPGTLLEEQASTAHAVGLKHTILMAFVTLGSLINFCDCLMAGGTSRKDHSEVGSGFIHFNFTPWGARGDKATPSLVGEVPRGVFYRERRIFLGGSGGMIGPRRVGFGAVAAAGQVVRHDVPADRLVLRTPPRISRKLGEDRLDGAGRKRRNLEYIGNLVALHAFYQQVRCVRADDASRPLMDAALETLQLAIDERVTRLRAYLDEREKPMPELQLSPSVAEQCPLDVEPGSAGEQPHMDWIRSLDESTRAQGVLWLRAVADAAAGLG